MLKVEELEKQVNSGVAEGIYLFYGAETFLLEQQVKKMKKVFVYKKKHGFTLFYAIFLLIKMCQYEKINLYYAILED